MRKSDLASEFVPFMHGIINDLGIKISHAYPYPCYSIIPSEMA